MEILMEYEEAEIFFYTLDITDTKSISVFCDFIEEHHKPIDCLVNNAGIGTHIDLWKDKEYPEYIIDTIFKTNYRGHVNLCSYLIPYLSKDAKVINVTSSAGILNLF